MSELPVRQIVNVGGGGEGGRAYLRAYRRPQIGQAYGRCGSWDLR